MKIRFLALSAGILGCLLLTSAPTHAQRALAAKFDAQKPMTMTGIVTHVDWLNPHVHIFMNVKSGAKTANWAVELPSTIALEESGWSAETVHVGDTLRVKGVAARNGSRQIWGDSVVMVKTGHPLFTLDIKAPPQPLSPRPTPRWPDKQPRLGPEAGGFQGYWAFPTSTVLEENGANVAMGRDGLLKNIADAPKVAPMQPWALALYRERQQRFLQDDPMYLYCKPPGGPRQFELPEGVQFVEDHPRQRIFVLMGGGNTNYRIIYLDGRKQVGQVAGDDDNPLYYGRSVAQWEGDTLVVDTNGFNEDFWFTNGGLPHTSMLHLVEKFTRPDLDNLKYEVTIDDPGAYTRQWSSGWNLRWVANQELPRNVCQDNRP
ncbi:MAG TPA: DUF6152 family protein [Vicinamibacterales bacterium]|nr:DUF6152 family protein [Vicinamibacterales bacterium]